MPPVSMPPDSMPPASTSAAESAGLDRRDFLKTVGAAVLTAGTLPGSTPAVDTRPVAAPRPLPCLTSPIS